MYYSVRKEAFAYFDARDEKFKKKEKLYPERKRKFLRTLYGHRSSSKVLMKKQVDKKAQNIFANYSIKYAEMEDWNPKKKIKTYIEPKKPWYERIIIEPDNIYK